MAKDPARRFQTPDEVARALAPFADAQVARAAAMDLDAPALRRRADPAGGLPIVRLDGGGSEAIGTRQPALVRARGVRAMDRGGPGPAAHRRGVPGPGQYRIQTATGELVIESDDPGIEVIVKQGGKRVTIVDTKTSHRIELKAGSYELQLAGGGEGLKLSTDTFMLKRGDKTVVTVRRESPKPQPASDLLAGTGTEEVGEIARFESPHDFVGEAFLLPDRRRVIYASAGGYEKDTWVEPSEPALWLGELADPKNPRRFTGHGPGGLFLALLKDGRLAYRRQRQNAPSVGRRDRQVTAYSTRGDPHRTCRLLAR